MSHFTVLVAISGSEATTAAEAEQALDLKLEPFNENLEVPEYTEWLSPGDVDRAVQMYRENPNLCEEEGDGPTKPFDQYVTEGNIEAWNEWTRMAVGGFYCSDRDRGVYDAKADRFGSTSSYNPDSKWDWWQLGGRWHGYWSLKPAVSVGAPTPPAWRKTFGESVEGATQVETFDGSQDAVLGLSGTGGDSPDTNFSGKADLARKRDIDFEGMRLLAGLTAEAQYTAYEEATRGIEPAPRWVDHLKLTLVEAGLDPEAVTLEREEDRARRTEVVNEARRTFSEHPWNQALAEAQLNSWFDENRDAWCVDDGGRETFVRRARERCFQTFAMLDEKGVWHESGKMGWFGSIGDEKDPDMWNREFNRALDNLPDDTWLAVVDCHI